jgi:hypothetical protein
MATAERLMDAGWNLLLFKQVDGKYCAAAKLTGENWEDIFALVNESGRRLSLQEIATSGDFSKIHGTRRPDRIGRGSSTAEAIGNISLEV